MMKFNLFTKSLIVTVLGFSLAYGFYQLSGDSLKNICSHSCWSRFVTNNFQNFINTTILSDVDTIEITTLNTDILMHSSHTENGKIEFTPGISKPQIKRLNHAVFIKVASQPGLNKSVATLTLPKSIKSIKVITLTGNVDMIREQVKSLSIQTDAGEISLHHVLSEKTNLHSTSGNINWNGSSNNANIFTTSGNVNFFMTKPLDAEIKAQTVSGHISIPNTSQNSNHFIQVKTVSGDIHIF